MLCRRWCDSLHLQATGEASEEGKKVTDNETKQCNILQKHKIVAGSQPNFTVKN